MQSERKALILEALEKREPVQRDPSVYSEFYRVRPLVCLMYGYPEWGVVAVHHIDEDKENNSLDNLIPLPKNEHVGLSRNDPFKKTVEHAVFSSITKAWIESAIAHGWNEHDTIQEQV